MADNTGDEAQDVTEDVDELAGEELFDVPADLEDEPAGAQTDEAGADPAEAEPPAPKPAAEQPRDEKGKFRPKDAAATDEGQPPEPSPGESSDAPSPTPEQAEAPEPEPELEFSFRADGEPIQIKGSRITADGIFIPRQYQQDLQRLLSHGVTYQGSFKQRLYQAKQEVEQTKAQVNEEVERSKTFLNFFANLLDRQEAGEPAIEEWLDDFRQNRVKLEAEATLAAAKALRERQPAPVRLEGFDEEPEPAGEATEEDLEELSQNLSPELDTRLSGVIQSEGIRGLTGPELTRIRDYMAAPQRIGNYFRVALEDLPEYGVKKGQIVAMDEAIKEELKYQAELILGARRAAMELRTAEQKNAARTKGNPIPPTTTVNGNGVPKGKKPVPTFKNKQEMEEWFAAEDPLS